MEPVVEKRTRAGSAYYSIHWSRLIPLSKEVVIGRIPSLAGIYEVYRYRGGPTARITGRSRAYYGGLRNTMRGLIDPVSPYPLNGELLDPDEEYLVRYSLISSSDDMNDILYFFANNPPVPDQQHSGRYAYIYVNESAPEPEPGEVVPETG